MEHIRLTHPMGPQQRIIMCKTNYNGLLMISQVWTLRHPLPDNSVYCLCGSFTSDYVILLLKCNWSLPSPKEAVKTPLHNWPNSPLAGSFPVLPSIPPPHDPSSHPTSRCSTVSMPRIPPHIFRMMHFYIFFQAQPKCSLLCVLDEPLL